MTMTKKVYSDEKLNLSQQALDRFVELARYAVKQETKNDKRRVAGAAA
jgi:hypothetical protein